SSDLLPCTGARRGPRMPGPAFRDRDPMTLRLRRLLFVSLLLAAPLQAQKLSYPEYAQAVTQAIRIGDEKRLDRTVRDNSVHTVTHYRGLTMTAIRNPEAGNQPERGALKASRERAFQGRTPHHPGRWPQAPDPP